MNTSSKRTRAPGPGSVRRFAARLAPTRSVPLAPLLSALLSAPVVLPASAFSSPPRAAAAIVAGDLIVKFRDTSEPGVALAAVLGGTRTVESAAPMAARLSQALGVPLKLVQVTSGREALLAIDREALQRSLAQRAAAEPGVARAVPVAPAVGLPADPLSVRVELAAQGTSQAASQASLAIKLATGNLLRPRLHTDGSGATLLSYDMAGLTLALIEQIRQQADVEYVQANQLLRAQPGKPR